MPMLYDRTKYMDTSLKYVQSQIKFAVNILILIERKICIERFFVLYLSILGVGRVLEQFKRDFGGFFFHCKINFYDFQKYCGI